MPHDFPFTWTKIRQHYENILAHGYKPISCVDYIDYKKSGSVEKVLINRVDIDLSVKKVERLESILTDLGIRTTFFLRLHAPEYNPFSFENYRIIKKILDNGHELGYHSEVIDQSAIWDEDATDCLLRDLDVINRMFNIEVKSVASHGGMTGLNNLDFWKDKKPSDFGLLYEAYDKQPEFNLFQECFYASDSEWTRWKCYNKGVRIEGDNRTPTEHAADRHPIFHLLVHPDTYYDRHIYDNEK
jgi:hypothetical protein